MTRPENLSSMDPATKLALVDAELDRAVQAADAAAHAAGVSLREITDLAELEEVVALFSTIWGRDASPPMNLELLRTPDPLAGSPRTEPS